MLEHQTSADCIKVYDKEAQVKKDGFPYLCRERDSSRYPETFLMIIKTY